MTSMVASPAHEWFRAHAARLTTARETIRSRAYWSAFAEVPSGKIYGDSAKVDGEAAFAGRLGATFELGQPGANGTSATERSPFGIALDIAYPISPIDALLAAARGAMARWVDAGPDIRAGVALEMLARLNAKSFEIALATMHTTGQAFVMAFQAGGPHAQDRALEAVAYAYDEMQRVPVTVRWEKPQGKAEPLRIDKTYRIVPRGIALTIGCSTFPNWNAYPGMFASLVTGNAVIVKPHPQAILPLAITVEVMRQTLRDAGFDPDLVLLAVDPPGRPLAKELALRPEIGLIDYTGSSEFGAWLESNAAALVYTEKAGVNSVVIDSTADFAGMLRNLALSVSLYSGQMCTTPQNVYMPREGIMTEAGRRSFADVSAAFVTAIDALLGVPERAADVLGAIASDATLARIAAESQRSGIVRQSAALTHPSFPGARIRTPLVAHVDAAALDRYGVESFGPIVYVIATDSTAHSLELATRSAHTSGAITATVHSTDPDVVAAATAAAADAAVSLAINFTGSLLVNQSAAFSDYHVSGGNPAGNASLTDAAFVANRFRIVETRQPVV